MEVKLINHTNNALELLLYTKNTRLQGAQSLQDICDWPDGEKMEHLGYMRDTIQSSWEFVEYVFEIKDVTRAFTHQLVRTRQASYAQQSQRTVDAREMGFKSTGDETLDIYMGMSIDAYAASIDEGITVQDARGALPTNMHTNIIAKFNLRTLHQMGLLRLCTRTQGEYQEVFKAMLAEVVKVHPWAKDFIKVHCAWYGTCAFPRYEECPIKPYTLHSDTLSELKQRIQDEWEDTDHEAVPVAKDGKTM